jgi:hypothetical protein
LIVQYAHLVGDLKADTPDFAMLYPALPQMTAAKMAFVLCKGRHEPMQLADMMSRRITYRYGVLTS